MERIAVSEARERISEVLNRVAYGGERVVLHRHGKEIAALIPMSDLRTLLRPEAPAETLGAKPARDGDDVARAAAPGRVEFEAGASIESAVDGTPSGRLIDDSDASPWIPRSL